MKKSAVLVVGVEGVGAEMLKNLVLGGVGRVVVWDPQPVTSQDLAANLFLRASSEGAGRASETVKRLVELNPHVQVEVPQEGWAKVEDLPRPWLRGFTVIVTCGLKKAQVVWLDTQVQSRSSEPPAPALLVLNTWGYLAGLWLRLPLGAEYQETVQTQRVGLDGAKIMEKVMRVVPNYPTFEATLAWWRTYTRKTHGRRTGASLLAAMLWEGAERVATGVNPTTLGALRAEISEEGRALVSDALLARGFPEEAGMTLPCELAPVAAIVGGIASQEVMKILTKMEAPYRTMFVFDGTTSEGLIEDCSPAASAATPE